MVVDVFIPCEMDQFYPQTAQNMIRVLDSMGCKAHYLALQTDCGKLAFENGNWEEARKIGEKFIKEFSEAKCIICPSPSTVSFIKRHYEKLFYNSTYHLEYQQIIKNLQEFCEFVYRRMESRQFIPIFEHNVYFHDCYTDQHSPIAMRLLLHVEGLRLLNKQNDNVCCGSGLLFGWNNAVIASALVIQTVEKAQSLGAEYIVVSDSLCKMQLESYVKKQNIPLIVIHIIDILVSGCENI